MDADHAAQLQLIYILYIYFLSEYIHAGSAAASELQQAAYRADAHHAAQLQLIYIIYIYFLSEYTRGQQGVICNGLPIRADADHAVQLNLYIFQLIYIIYIYFLSEYTRGQQQGFGAGATRSRGIWLELEPSLWPSSGSTLNIC